MNSSKFLIKRLGASLLESNDETPLKLNENSTDDNFYQKSQQAAVREKSVCVCMRYIVNPAIKCALSESYSDNPSEVKARGA